jgi:hypothetical protein
MKREDDYLFFNYWSYRYWFNDTQADGDIAFTLRSPQHLSFTSLRDVINEIRESPFIPTGTNIAYLHDRKVGVMDGWDMAIAFDLFPCFEVSYLHHTKKYQWKRVTA